jgi:peptidoglycan lytic transglycosylase
MAQPVSNGQRFLASVCCCQRADVDASTAPKRRSFGICTALKDNQCVPRSGRNGLAVICLLLTALFSQTALAQTPDDQPARVRELLEEGDFAAAATTLKQFRSADPAAFTRNNYDYLLARLAERNGDEGLALLLYQSVVDRQAAVAQYALWHLALLERASGDLIAERASLRRLLATAPNSLLSDGAAMRLGESLVESGDYPAAVIALRTVGKAKNATMARAAALLTAQALLGAGKTDDAHDIFAGLIIKMPDAARPDDYALQSVRGLDQIEKESKQPGRQPLSVADHLLRASIYQFNRDFEGARPHYQAVLQLDARAGTAAEALYQLGRGYYLEQQFEQALPYFQRVTEQFPDSLSARDALGYIAASYNRLRRTDQAVAAYKSYLERYPDAPNPERPYLNIIDALRDAGRDQEALDWVQRTRARFPEQIGGTLALFAQAKINFARESWQAASNDLERLEKAKDLGGARVPGGTTTAEIVFMRAFALEKLGRVEAAIDLYLSLPDGRAEYYGHRATERARALDADPRNASLATRRLDDLRSRARQSLTSGNADAARIAAQQLYRLSTDADTQAEALNILRQTYKLLAAYHLPDYSLASPGRQTAITAEPSPNGEPRGEPTHASLADELLFLALYDEAVPELIASRYANGEQKLLAAQSGDKATPTDESGADRAYTLAVLGRRGDHADLAVRFAEQVWKPVPPDYVLELAPAELVNLLYPAPYHDALLQHSAEHGVDPRLLLAIARQESRFQPAAKSVAAARGLMQFIAATANEVAGQLKVRQFEQDSLYNPDVALLFGAQYLEHLFKQFPGQPQAVVGSYNGGPENLARWIARSHSQDPDRYVPEIGFAQTKDYVYRVLSNYWAYEALYSNKLERK